MLFEVMRKFRAFQVPPAGMAANGIGVICCFHGKRLSDIKRSWCTYLADVTAEEDVFCFLVWARCSPTLADRLHYCF